MGGEDQAVSEDQETEEPGMLELTGEERTIPLSEDTEVVEISMGGRPEGEEPPEGQEPSFYGVGAAILAEEGTVSISESTISTDADGGAGIFAYGNSTVYVADTEIYTEKDTSGGIHAAGGGTLYAWDVSAATKGESSAAIRSDRGGGTMIVEGGDYTTGGTGSPAVYCTADIAVKDAELTAGNSEAVCMEGLNTLHLFDCELSGNMQDLDQNDCTWTIIVYQSMSGRCDLGFHQQFVFPRTDSGRKWKLSQHCGIRRHHLCGRRQLLYGNGRFL